MILHTVAQNSLDPRSNILKIQYRVTFAALYTGCPGGNVPDFGENVPYVKVHRYNPKHLYPKVNGYGDNGESILKVWQLLHTYWLTNTY